MLGGFGEADSRSLILATPKTCFIKNHRMCTDIKYLRAVAADKKAT